MRTTFFQKLGALTVAISVLGLTIQQPAAAAIISTDTAIEIEQRQVQIDRINEIIARENVHNMLVGMGVDPADASERIAALTDEELVTLEAKLDRLPAGGAGVVEVVGIVAIVLIVLELLHVTNFFTEF